MVDWRQFSAVATGREDVAGRLSQADAGRHSRGPNADDPGGLIDPQNNGDA
jgi:hypothetical protein